MGVEPQELNEKLRDYEHLIAKRLHISQHTVRNHLKSMFRKLEVGNQSELIDRVRSLGDDAPAAQV